MSIILKKLNMLSIDNITGHTHLATTGNTIKIHIETDKPIFRPHILFKDNFSPDNITYTRVGQSGNSDHPEHTSDKWEAEF